MNGKLWHKEKRNEVKMVCKELKSKYGKDWPFVMSIIQPDEWCYFKNFIRKNP